MVIPYATHKTTSALDAYVDAEQRNSQDGRIRHPTMSVLIVKHGKRTYSDC